MVAFGGCGGEGSLWPWPFDGGRGSGRPIGGLVVLVPWSQVPPTDCWTGRIELDHEGTDIFKNRNRSTYNDTSQWHIDKVLCSYVP